MTSVLDMENKLLREIALSHSVPARVAVNGFLNDAKRRLWHAHAWRERKAVGTLVTTAPYSTGTLVATKDSASVTGTGTTWVTGQTGMKLAIGLSQPFYAFTFATTTAGTLGRDYLEATVSGSGYILYKDVYSLASDLDIVRTKHLVPMIDSYDRPLTPMTDEDWFRYGMLPRHQNKPNLFRLVEDSTADPSSSRQQIQLWPVPDAAYAIRYEYLKLCKTMESQGKETEIQFREELRDFIVQLARADTYRYNNENQRAELYAQREGSIIERAWADNRSGQPMNPRRRGVDRGAATGRFRRTHVEYDNGA